MKRIAQLLTLTLLLVASHSTAQLRIQPTTDLAWTEPGIAQSLEGSWRATTSPDSEGRIVLQKCTTLHCWGRFFTFEAGGKMQTGYAVPCGNDPNYRFFPGTWSWNPAVRQLTTSANFDEESSTTFRIEKVTSETLVLLMEN